MMLRPTGTALGLLSLAITGLCVSAHAADAPLPANIDFNRDIRRILSDNCYACHGPDKNKRKADLRLDTHDGIFSKIEDRTTVLPGNVTKSELFRRITTDDAKERMPDPKSNKRLSNREIALIKKWIEQGANWQGHWAYIKPVRPEVPKDDDGGFAKNPVDHFILAKLKDAGLTPAPEADRATLIRRLSMDLVGLPPTLPEVEAFEKDQSADAYDKVVDRLLASPHFGERMAVYWLDLVRFADTIGYHSDNPMNVSPYRDYVIKSFNDNKPFDKFTIEQLAGDLLPKPTIEQQVATCYNRLLQTTEEGGAQAREYEVKNLTDRVRNVSTVWMGATMGCSQCHDHKFDPITQHDFYNMGAFFADVKETAIGNREPGMPVPSAEQEKQVEQFGETLAADSEKLKNPSASLADEQAKWEKANAEMPVVWNVQELTVKTAGGTKLTKQSDGSYLASGKIPAKETYTLTLKPGIHGITGVRIEALPDDKLATLGPGASETGNFIVTGIKFEITHPGQRALILPLARSNADFSQEGFSASSLIDKKGGGWGIDPKIGDAHNIIIEPKEPVNTDDNSTLTLILEFQSAFPQNQIGKLRVAVTNSPLPAGMKSLPTKLRDTLAIDADKRTKQQSDDLATYFRTIAPSLQPTREEIVKITRQKEDLLKQVPKCLVTTAAAPRVVKLLHRGNWLDTTGDEMKPALPGFLASKDLQDEATKRRLTRLDLAQWLVARDNPLTARVYVNRLWRLYFGTGLSKVMDDLGSQGEWPTHPELLDWMAVEFMDSGWDVKHMAKLLVSSATYRQSSKPSALDLEKDPYNRLLSHQSRWRIDAEFVRDNALAVSGLLVDKLGGPSVKPYQPDGYWVQLNFPTRVWVADKGENQYRRGLYTWWQRSFLQPSLASFDASSREEAVCERNRSNIPQQALVLLNDPTYVEASRSLAGRILHEGGTSIADRLNFAYEVVLSRKPRPEETQLLTALYEKHVKEFSTDDADAGKLLTVGQAQAPKDVKAGELAAWTSVARVILNLHETITRM